MQAGVGIEIWTMTGGMLFDNILVTQSEEDAADFATKVGHTHTHTTTNGRLTHTRAAPPPRCRLGL